MKWCKNCGKKVDWMMGNNRWILVDINKSSPNYGKEHSLSCIPNKAYIEKNRQLLGK